MAEPNFHDWNRQIIEEFRTNGGKVGGPFEGVPLLLLTTTGAKSGHQRINPLTNCQGTSIPDFGPSLFPCTSRSRAKPHIVSAVSGHSTPNRCSRMCKAHRESGSASAYLPCSLVNHPSCRARSP
jgi:hypothetical protein